MSNRNRRLGTKGNISQSVLTERERLFVEAFMGAAAGNATRAAIRAGYSRSVARKQGCLLLKRTRVKVAIDARASSDPAVWTREERQQFWTAVAQDPSIRMRERLRASELLGRSCGDFIERRELTGPRGRTLEEIIAAARAPENGEAE